MEQVSQGTATAHNLLGIRAMIMGICDILVSKNLCTAEEMRTTIAKAADEVRESARSEFIPAMRASLMDAADGIAVSAHQFEES